MDRDPLHDPFDGDEDAALRYAIALSLQEADASQRKPATSKELIELSSDEDDDLEKGPPHCPPTPKKSARSNNENGPVKDEGRSAAVPTPPAPLQKSVVQSSQPTGLAALGLDRKKMEEERLARIAKRKAPSEPASGESEAPAPQRVKLDPSRRRNVPIGAPTLPYPKGVVKKTWASGYPRRGDDIKIEEVLQKDQLELAVLSSFQWDDEWLLSKVDIGKTKMICVAFASSEAQKNEMRENVPRERIRFCFPPMPTSMGIMHSKLQLLKFPKYLRVVIPTANLVPYDWGETGVMENMVFLIDLPLLETTGGDDKNNNNDNNKMTLFGQELCYFLKASGLDEGLINSLSKYDFSETERYRFVHSIGQSHTDPKDWKRTGYCGLGRAVASLGLATTARIELDLVAASLGSLNPDLLSAIYNAAQGGDGLKEYEYRLAPARKKKDMQGSKPSYDADNFRIYFPSRDTVRQSRGGTNAGGTICAQRKWWQAPTFPRELMRDCKSVRPGLLMHSKILFARHPPSEEDGTQKAWAYVGSANLSESAWGRLVKDRSTGQPKLTCRNWECGVVIPVETNIKSTDSKDKEKDKEKVEEKKKDLKSVFEDTVPVPMAVPGEPYGWNSDSGLGSGSGSGSRSRPKKEPWLYMEG